MLKQELINQLTVSKSITIPMWLKRVRPDILKYLEQETIQYDVKNVMERVYIVLNGEPPKCSDGNYRKFDTFEKGYRLGCNLNHKCKDVVTTRVEKQKITMKQKYGVTNAAQLDSVKKKIKETNLKKYGVEHHMKLESQRSKVYNTCLINHGEAHPARIQANKKQLKQYNLDKYGFVSFSQSHYSKEACEFINNDDLFVTEVKNNTVQDLVKKYNISTYPIYSKIKQLGIQPFRSNISSFEKEVRNFITSCYNGVVEYNVRNIIRPLEIDIYLPDLNFAIECNGTYWHSELGGNKKKSYHATKTESAKDQNIRLFNIWEHDWKNKQSIIQSMILSRLNLNTKIHARKCKIIPLSSKQASDFVNTYHLQGNAPSSVKFGLCYEDDLVMVMTFATPRFTNDHEFEIIRLATKSGLTVVGGASKLLNHFVKTYNPKSIITYSDKMHSSGKVYEQLGFTYYKTTSPGYKYTRDYNLIFNRTVFQKNKLVSKLDYYDPTLSEWENMQMNSYDRIWDCGNDVFLWKSK